MAATIVLAEDDSDLRAIYAQCLRRAGHVVWEAADGAPGTGPGSVAFAGAVAARHLDADLEWPGSSGTT